MVKKFLLAVLIFLLIPTALVWFVARFDNRDAHSSSNNNIISLQNKHRFDSLDILFAGNSYCYSGVMPAVFDSLGIRTFNMGIATCGTQFYDLVLPDYINHCRQQPKVVCLLLAPIMFADEADNFSEYPIHRYLAAPISNEALTGRYLLLGDYIPLTVHSFKKGTTNLTQKQPDTDISKFLLTKGYIPTDKVAELPDIEKAARLYANLKKQAFRADRFAQMKRFASDLKARGIQPVFFELPTNRLVDFFTEEYLLAYRNAVNELGKTERVFPAITLPRDSFYRDIDHLNSSGAYLATQNLLANIRQDAELNRLVSEK